jgi:hypothetical protein
MLFVNIVSKYLNFATFSNDPLSLYSGCSHLLEKQITILDKFMFKNVLVNFFCVLFAFIVYGSSLWILTTFGIKNLN